MDTPKSPLQLYLDLTKPKVGFARPLANPHMFMFFSSVSGFTLQKLLIQITLRRNLVKINKIRLYWEQN